MTSDMYPHWRYVIETILGPIARVVTAAPTAIAERADEQGRRFAVDVDDSAMTLVQLAGGAVGTIISTWAARIRRDDILTLQIDGSGGSALAGIHRCWTQSAADTPEVRHMNPSLDLGADYRAGWNELPAGGPYTNPYRMGWEQYLRHLADDAPMVSDLAAGIRDIQLAEACKRSIAEAKWVELDSPSGPAGHDRKP
jgi:predicted dehydrogenase